VALDELTDGLEDEEQGEIVLRPQAVLRRTGGVVVDRVPHGRDYVRGRLWCIL
jgi:hypothetical protein